MECHIKSLLSPWEASMGRASIATCPGCEQRALAQSGGRGCRRSNFNPSLGSPRGNWLRMKIVYRETWGSEGQYRLLGPLLCFLWTFLFPYIHPHLTDNAKHNLFAFFCQPEQLERFPDWQPRHRAWVF